MSDLGFFVRQNNCRFEQSVLMNEIGKGTLVGLCLSLSSAFIHLRRNDHEAATIIGAFKSGAIRTAIAQIQEDYGAGKLSGGSKVEAQEETTIRAVFEKTLKVLVESKSARNQRTLINRTAIYPTGDRPTLKGCLFPSAAIMRSPRKLFLVVFNYKGGRVADSGAHAIVVEDFGSVCGIFDPDFGWMQLAQGFNGVDLGVVLNAFDSEYGITGAVSFQDLTDLA